MSTARFTAPRFQCGEVHTAAVRDAEQADARRRRLLTYDEQQAVRERQRQRRQRQQRQQKSESHEL